MPCYVSDNNTYRFIWNFPLRRKMSGGASKQRHVIGMYKSKQCLRPLNQACKMLGINSIFFVILNWQSIYASHNEKSIAIKVLSNIFHRNCDVKMSFIDEINT